MDTIKITLFGLYLLLFFTSCSKIQNKIRVTGGQVILFSFDLSDKDNIIVRPYEHISDYQGVEQYAGVYIKFKTEYYSTPTTVENKECRGCEGYDDKIIYMVANWSNDEIKIAVDDFWFNDTSFYRPSTECQIKYENTPIEIREEFVEGGFYATLNDFIDAYNSGNENITTGELNSLVFFMNTFKIPETLKESGVISIDLTFNDHEVFLEGLR